MARTLSLPLFAFLLLLLSTTLPHVRSLPTALPRRSVATLPHANISFLIEQRPRLSQAEGVKASCSYTVTIATSCKSPRYTWDQISLEFGDSYGNQVYLPRLDDPTSGTFEQCSTDTFKITGPCTYATCFLYLYRYGNDGWVPDYVMISDSYGTMNFYFGMALPNGRWYGYDLCDSSSTKLQPSAVATTTAAVIGLLLFLLPPFSLQIES